MPPGVGVLPIMTYKGPLYLRPDERVGILLLVEVYKRVGESSFWSVKGLKRANRLRGLVSGGNLPYKTLLSTPRIMHSLENSVHGKILVYSLC